MRMFESLSTTAMSLHRHPCISQMSFVSVFKKLAKSMPASSFPSLRPAPPKPSHCTEMQAVVKHFFLKMFHSRLGFATRSWGCVRALAPLPCRFTEQRERRNGLLQVHCLSHDQFQQGYGIPAEHKCDQPGASHLSPLFGNRKG